MNLHLHKVLSDITGVTGMKIIRAIVRGEKDPRKLALMREAGVKKTDEKRAVYRSPRQTLPDKWSRLYADPGL